MSDKEMNEFGGDAIGIFGVGTNGRFCVGMEDRNGADEMED